MVVTSEVSMFNIDPGKTERSSIMKKGGSPDA